jgi:hypothetical protein
MFLPAIIRDYFVWHYTRAWWELWGVWRNYIWFVGHFFSIGQLMRSWFAPFKRITERRGNTWNTEDLAAYIIINIISRLIGAIARTAIILIGIIALCITIVVGIIIYTIWMLLPIIIFGLVGMSLSLFFISI